MKIKRFFCTVLCLILLISPTEALAKSYTSSDSQIVSVTTPTEEAPLKWSRKFSENYKNAPSTQAVVDDTLIVMSGKTLYKLNAETGETLKTAEMADVPSFGYTSPLYADGVVYCPLDNAKIQAFNYKTMKSMWVYTDSLGGQSLTPITYDDGCIYTGFWNDETLAANYVCINVKDEKPRESYEVKSAVWTYENVGGFYRAGCAVFGDNVIFGCDDGTVYSNKPSKAVSVNKRSGRVSDTISIVGDQRASMTAYSGRVYFTTKAGLLYSVKINSDGTFDKASLKTLSLGGASTSTPVIYNGRLYVGVQGTGFGTGFLKVIDAERLTVIYSAQTKGYPQGMLLLSDAYFAETGKVKLYLTYNAAPGGITMFSDGAGQTKAESCEVFTPTGEMSNYCISSVVCGENGTLFYKNDSGYVFALGEKTEKPSLFRRIINAIVNFFKRLFG